MKKLFASFFLLLSTAFFPSLANAQTDSGNFYTSFDGTRIYYEVKGNGYPVILVHGFMNTAENMKRNEVCQQLLNTGYKVIVLDMRGNGRSDKPHNDEAYANDAEAKDIIALAT